jgi:N-carbamoylputrescine amidase
MDKVKVALLQLKLSDNIEKNLEQAVKAVENAALQKAQVICLPELFKTNYFCQTENKEYFNLAEEAPFSTVGLMQNLAKKHNIVLIVPFFEKRHAGVYHNTVAVIDADGSILGYYRKMHIPEDPSFYEKFYFSPGDLGYKVFQTKYCRVGVLICWDQWFPEAARITALKGADIIFYPTAIGWLPDESEEECDDMLNAWLSVQKGHAIANGVHVAAANRVGFEKSPDNKSGIKFWGNSFLANPNGKLLSSAGSNESEVLCNEIDLKHQEETRNTWPFFRDRRIDSYNDILKRFD